MHFENGLHHISNEQYHRSDGISRSMLCEIKKSPFHYWYKYLSGQYVQEDATPAMNIGSAVHCLVLEPHLFKDSFYICEQKTRPVKDSTSWHKMLELARGRIVLTETEINKASAIANAVRADSYCQLLFKDCHIEDSVYFTHEATGLQVKVRPDAWYGSIAFDLKTTNDASTRAFEMSSYRYDYYLQAAMNFKAFESIGIMLDEFVFVVVEKEPPYPIAFFRVRRDDFYKSSAYGFGLEQFDSRMSLLLECMNSNEWPGYGVKDLDVPGWAHKELLNDE
jgi:hypothetical protein